jgi:hypothetical protein
MNAHRWTIVLVCLLMHSPLHAQWFLTDGPTGGTVRCLAIGATSLFAGTDSGGVYRSTDNGASWSVANTGLAGKTVSSISVSAERVLALTNSGVFCSTNSGVAWAASGTIGATVSCVAVSGSVCLAGTSGGIYRSTNDGADWSTANTGLANTTVQFLTVTGTNTYASTASGVFRSTNYGLSWSTAGLTGVSVTQLAAAGIRLLAGTTTGISLSTNQGGSWTTLTVPSTMFSALAVSGSDLIVAFFMGVKAGTRFVDVSTDNGVTWTQKVSGLTDTEVLSFAVNGSNLCAGTRYGGVFLSSNLGTSWNEANAGLMRRPVAKLLSSGTMVFAGTLDGGVYRSTNGGVDWVSAKNGLGETWYKREISGVVMVGSTLFAAIGRPTYRDNGGVYASTNNGTSWTKKNSTWLPQSIGSSGTAVYVGTIDGVHMSTDQGSTWSMTGLAQPNVFAFLAIPPRLFAGARTAGSSLPGGVFVTTDNGANWPQTGLTNVNVYALAAIGSTILAGTDSHGVYRSTDYGVHWTQSGLSGSMVRAFAVASPNVFAGTDAGVFISTNAGVTWLDANEGLGNTHIRSLAVSADNLLAGTSAGVWMTAIGDISVPIRLSSFSVTPVPQQGAVLVEWKTLSETDNYGFLIEKAPAGGQAQFAEIPASFTAGQGTTQVPHTYAFLDREAQNGPWSYRLRQIDLDGSVHFSEAVTIAILTGVVKEMPAVFALRQNYPNPFNPATVVSGESPVASHVRIVVYDVLGREAVVLMDEQRDAGAFEVKWNAQNFASGVYVCRMEAGSFVKTMSMILAK